LRATRQSRQAKGTSVLQQAARAHGVPLWVLVGVKLQETGSGTGASNPFQFEPSTAASAGVRDVNNFSESANGAAALLASYHRKFGSWNAAFEAYNGGEGAVGGGYAYNEADILGKLKEFGTSKAALTAVEKRGSGTVPVSITGTLGEGLEWLQHNFGSEAGVPGIGTPGVQPGTNAERAGEAASSLSIVPEAIGDFFSLLTKGETWIRLAEILAGAVLIFLALKGLTGADLPTPGVTLG
jgi:hypothetical protein